MITTNYYNTLFTNLQRLSPTLQEQVLDYVQYLVSKYNKTQDTKDNTSATNQKPYREFGKFKGKIIVPPDFNEPLDDFKDY